MKTKLFMNLVLLTGIGVNGISASANIGLKANSLKTDISAISTNEIISNDFMKIENWMSNEAIWKIESNNSIQSKKSVTQRTSQLVNENKIAVESRDKTKENSNVKTENIAIEEWMSNPFLWKIK